MALRSGYIEILMIYVIFGVFTRNLVHGGNESTTTEIITDLTSTKFVELTTSLGTTPVNISSTKFSALMAADPNITPSASVTSISNTTLSIIGTSTSLTTKSSSTAMASGAVQLTGTTPVNISSTKLSTLVAADPNTTPSASVTSISNITLSASGTSISNTTLSTIRTSTSLTTKSSSTTATLGTVRQTESPKVLQTSCQDLNTPCMNNGTCTPGGTCLCPSSWTGSRCEYPCFSDGCPSEMDVCMIDRKCNLNGTIYCSNKTECLCFPGWNGSTCNISVCDNYYCYNGGKCLNNSGNAVCDCVRDAVGTHCEHNMEYSCIHMPFPAVDRIISCTDNIGYYSLECKPQWTGKNCETPINMTEFCQSNKCHLQYLEYCNAVCERGNCSQNFMALKADDYNEYSGDYQLNSEATDTPRGCSFTLEDPWDMCNVSNCIEKFANGFCDANCNNEACLFDGYDCIDGKGFLEDCSPYFSTPCSYNLTFDGKCDKECNTTYCLYDGFDCALSGLSPLPGHLVIQTQPIGNINSILRKIGLLLRSGVNATLLDIKPQIFEVYLKLTCSGLVNKNCFTSIQTATKFLAAYVAKRTVPDLFVRDIFVCEDGYYGSPGCSSQCSEGCKNSTSMEICNKQTGKCLDGCRDEFYGPMCDMQCNDNCGDGVGRLCDVDSGICTYPCKKGYYGPGCDNNCNDNCIDSCDTNGTCIGGCQGNLSYGLDCKGNCPRGCQNSTCDQLGKCHACMIGYYGDDCTKLCPKGCFEGCSQTTGDCFTCKAHHRGNKCEADTLHSKYKEETPAKTDYTGVIVGVIASVFIIAGAILIAFLCWRRQQSGDYILDEEAGTKTNANLEAVTTVQDQNSHMTNFASSKDAVDLDDMHDNSVYVGRSQAAYVKSTDHHELAENSPETTLGINNHSQIQPSVEITLTADLDESNEKFVNSDKVDFKLPPPDYAAETRDTDDQSSDDREDVVVRNSGPLVAGGAPLAASEASLLSKDTLDEPPQSDDEPVQPDDEPPKLDDQFMFEDGNLPQITEADFNEGNISDEEEEEKETRKSRSSSSSSSSDNN